MAGQANAFQATALRIKLQAYMTQGNVRRYAPPLVWAAVIFTATSIPGSVLPGTFAHADKAVHLALYAALGFLLARALRSEPENLYVYLLALLLCSAVGAADEWHQQFVPGRTTELLDWMADTVGSLFGVVAALWRTRLGRSLSHT